MLVITLTKVSNEKEQGRPKKYKMCSLKRKPASGNLTLEIRLVLRKRRGLKWNGIKGMVSLGQDPPHTHTQLIPQLVKEKVMWNFVFLTTTNLSVCKSNSRSGPDSIASRQLDLAASVTFSAFRVLWLRRDYSCDRVSPSLEVQRDPCMKMQQ